MHFFKDAYCFLFRGKKLKEGKLPFFAAGISSVVHPVSSAGSLFIFST